MKSTHGAPYQTELDAYLAGLDRTLPHDTVAGVYLTGSIALGDYHHGQSDLDILTLTTRPLHDEELTALDELHQRLKRETQPHTDAAYVPRECVGTLPDVDAAGQGYVVDGVFRRGGDQQDLVVWAILDLCGVTLRGPEAKTLGAAPDPAAFRAWNRGNLEEYWHAQATRLRDGLGERPEDEPMPAFFAVWFGTGPGRLHRTIATGEIISKSASADYTAQLFPAYRDLLARVKATRAGDESITYSVRDGLDLCDLVEGICEDARKIM